MNLTPDSTAETVLVLTQTGDSTADLVTTELENRSVRVIQIDPGDFPLTLRVSAGYS